jgi:glycosyltransferase involved in cell wall biosynthesis
MKEINFPKISIVTPVLNQKDFIKRCIESIVHQNYPNIEYIVMDGGSTDGTLEIIKLYEDRISFWQCEPDSGMYDALNKGFRKATGDILGWLNGDDQLFTGSLSIIADIFHYNKKVDWLTGFASNIDSYGRIVKVREQPFLTKYNFYHGRVKGIQQESTFFSKKLFFDVGGQFNIRYRYAADYELWCRFFQKAKLYYVNTIIGSFCRHSGQISERYNKEYYREVNEIRTAYKMKMSMIERLLVFFFFFLYSLKNNREQLYYNSALDHFTFPNQK